MTLKNVCMTLLSSAIERLGSESALQLISRDQYLMKDIIGLVRDAQPELVVIDRDATVVYDLASGTATLHSHAESWLFGMPRTVCQVGTKIYGDLTFRYEREELIVGPRSIQVIDLETNTTSQIKTNLPPLRAQARYDCIFHDGCLFLISGKEELVSKLDLTTGKWSRRRLPMDVLGMYVCSSFGSKVAFREYRSLAILDLGTWMVEELSIPYALESYGTVVLNLDEVWIYDCGRLVKLDPVSSIIERIILVPIKAHEAVEPRGIGTSILIRRVEKSKCKMVQIDLETGQATRFRVPFIVGCGWLLWTVR